MTSPSASASHSDDLERLTRWQDAGGLWQVVARTRDGVTISLCRCDGGEEVDRFTTRDPLALGHIGDRDRSDE